MTKLTMKLIPLLLLIMISWFKPFHAYGQNLIIKSSSQINSISDNNLIKDANDTLVIRSIIKRLKKVASKNRYADMDSIRYFASKALNSSISNNYAWGILQVYGTLARVHSMHDKEQDSAKYFYKLAIKEAEIQCDTFRLLSLYYYYGKALYQEANWDSSITAFNIGKQLSIEQGDTFNISWGLESLSRVYSYKGDLVASVENCLELIRLNELQKDTLQLVMDYWWLMGLYSTMSLREKETETLNTIFKLANKSTSSNLQWYVHNAAENAYYDLEKFDSVIYYARRSLPLYRKKNMMPACWLNLANAFVKLNQGDSAKYYLDLFIDEARANNIPLSSDVYFHMGKYESKFGEMDLALQYLLKAKSLQGNAALFTKREISKALYEYYLKAGKFREALSYLESYKHLDDSLLSNRITYDIGIASMESESEKMQIKLELVSKENELNEMSVNQQRLQKNLIIGFAGLFFILGGFGFYRFRKMKEIKARQSILDERLRISRDLHDEVGATLSGIAMYSHLAIEQSKESSRHKLEDTLKVITESSGEMVRKMGEIIWLLNPDFDSLQKLMEKLEDFSKKAALSKRMRIRTDLPPDIDQVHLSFEARKNIYLICKEAIHNAMKYSQAKELSIEVIKEDSKVIFKVIDNGLGFDKDTVSAGHGLGNMKSRAGQIGALFNLISAPMQGTEVMLEYDLIQ